jgi:hypothetical protein
VLVGDGCARLIRRRETYADLLQNEVFDSIESDQIGVPRLSAKKGSL